MQTSSDWPDLAVGRTAEWLKRKSCQAEQALGLSGEARIAATDDQARKFATLRAGRQTACGALAVMRSDEDVAALQQDW